MSYICLAGCEPTSFITQTNTLKIRIVKRKNFFKEKKP